MGVSDRKEGEQSYIKAFTHSKITFTKEKKENKNEFVHGNICYIIHFYSNEWKMKQCERVKEGINNMRNC